MIWATLGLLWLAAFIVVLPPLLRSQRAGTRAERDLAVYRDQLAEVDADAARGLISAADAEGARIEIKRRILALGPDEEAREAAKASRPLAAAVAVAIVGVSLALYLSLGRPGLPSRPYDAAAEQRAEVEAMAQQIDQMVARVEARVKAAPNDAQAWRILGWSYLQLGRMDESVKALKRAAELDKADGTVRSMLGEALVRAADGKVTAEAEAVFDEALKRAPKDPRARFYKGLALAQAGKDRAAFDLWVAVLRDGPADADWVPGIRAQAQALAVKLKLDPKTAVP